jgi:hypothetical protein
MDRPATTTLSQRAASSRKAESDSADQSAQPVRARSSTEVP